MLLHRHTQALVQARYPSHPHSPPPCAQAELSSAPKVYDEFLKTLLQAKELQWSAKQVCSSAPVWWSVSYHCVPSSLDLHSCGSHLEGVAPPGQDIR